MKLSEQLKQQRTQRHWSQQDLADHLKISRQSISKWERGTALPSFANVVAISDLFQLSLDELIRDDSDMMAELTNDDDTWPIAKVVYGGLIVGVLGYLLTLALGIGYEDAEALVAFPIFIIFVVLLMVVYANQRHHRLPLSRAVIWLGIGLVALMILPMISMNVDVFAQNFMRGAEEGWKSAR